MTRHETDSLRQHPLSHGLWAHSAAPAPEASSLSGNVSADVLVIGAGFTGLAAALRLAEQGAEVAVLEAADIGYGASGRNVGLVNAGLWLSPQEVLERLGNDYGERLMTMLGEAPGRVFELAAHHDMACEARRTGTLHCAHSAAGFQDLQRRAEHWTARGAPVELLDQSEAAAKIGSNFFHGALLDRRAGTVQPLGYARGLAGAAVTAGARIYVHSPVRAVERREDGWRAVTGGGSATARSVILATNAYTTDIAPITDCIVPFSFFQMSTPPLPAGLRETILPEGQGAWDTAKILTSLRLDADGRLVAGSMGRLDPRWRGVHANWLRRKIGQVFPQLGKVSFEYAWHGTIATTGDHLPRMAAPEEGLVAAFGYNGRGIGTGTMFGRAMADYILSGDAGALPLPLTPLRPEPARALRSMGIELALKAYHCLSNRF